MHNVTSTEHQLITAAAAGCRTSFEKLMRAHVRVMRAAAAGAAKGLALNKKGLLDEALALAWRLRQALIRKVDALDAWLWSITVSCSIKARKRAVAEQIEEDQLIDAALAGDGASFNKLMHLHAAVMTDAANRYTRGTTTQLEDVLAEARLRAWRFLPKFKRTCRIGTWLFRLTMNVALDELAKHAKRKVEVTFDDELHEDADEGAEHQAEQRLLLGRAQELLAALEELPRELFTGHVLEGLSFVQLGRMHKLHRETVSQVVGEVMAQMRTLQAT